MLYPVSWDIKDVVELERIENDGVLDKKWKIYTKSLNRILERKMIMEDYIQIKDKGYIVKISLENMNYEDIPDLLNKIKDTDTWNWISFDTNDKLWYRDFTKYLICHAINYNDKIIIFG